MKNHLVTRAHFYTLLTGVCALCEEDSPDSQMSGLVLRHSVPYKGLPPLRRLCVYPSALCGGNSLLVQTISVAESENPISLTRPSTENVGGLFLSIIYQSGGQNHA